MPTEFTDHDLLTLPLPDLLGTAREVRASSTGTVVTYSPKVFIPLTRLCHDACTYCTFATSPASLPAPYLSQDEVLAIARRGAQAGCHEALFTLGERPEDRYQLAQDWLAQNGYAGTVDYLAAMCALVRDDTGLLPHANAGAMTEDELARLRPVSASQGMMLESLAPDLDCHRLAPDKDPARRLATLEAAGRRQIPFTTGVLVGIGDTRAQRLAAYRAIAESHARHGHVQEVIVQNFVPKPRTGMRNTPACGSDEELWSLAAARLVLPPDIAVQAPPNLTDDLGVLLEAGICDWGGVSPVTADHVNPERPWPAVDRLREVTQAAGLELAPRLTVYPRYVADPGRWLDPDLRFPVMDRADAAGYGRDDPGSHFPERVERFTYSDDGADVVLAGDLSTSWYAGSSSPPPLLIPSSNTAPVSGPVADVLAGVEAGEVPGEDELVTLFSARGREVAAVCATADRLRRNLVGDTVTWVFNRNINYTNVCTFKCRFCGFSKGPLSLNLRGTPYLRTMDAVAKLAVQAKEMGATEVCLQGGIHPDFDGNYYVSVVEAVSEAVPDMHIHAFSALEVFQGAKRNSEPLETYLTRLRDAGLRSLPGTAAEILADDVRATLCQDKLSTEEWLEVHRTAHRVGLSSNVTIMFGHIEAPRHWATHLVRTRALQAETGGFTEFVPLPFVHMASPIYLQHKARRGPTFREALLIHAVGRIAYSGGPKGHGRIPNVQASWVKMGHAGASQLLQAGCNDMGGTLIDENISRAAGASHGQMMNEADFGALAAPLGRPTARRTTLYEVPTPA